MAASSLVAATAVIGVLHAPFARSLLMRAGGCPFADASRMTSTEMEKARHFGLAEQRGSTAAPARPAFGFVLESTRLADVRSWAAAAHVTCDEPHPGLMTCHDVPASAVGLASDEPNVGELALGFNGANRLVNASAFRSQLSAEVAARAASEIASRLQERLGPAESRHGTFDTATLSRPAASSIATLSYRYSDYVAEVSAMNLPSGASVREHYMSAAD